MKNYKNLVKYNGEFHAQFDDGNGSNSESYSTYATLWFDNDTLMYVEPFSQYGSDKHYYNRIGQCELENEFKNIRYYI